ncbi:unnamed protein product [Ilex paraguariensis]|uniref:Uncharacterized protein n=1 Tax=Ilex paraguariensis TaxID=185542 RepID=A0ABC8S1U2_9AQUA
MGARKNSGNDYTDRQKWNKIFNALVHMLQTQHTQLEYLATERKLLEDRIKSQYERWLSDVKLFQDQISQMKRDLTVQEMESMVEAAKSDLIIGSKQREAFMCKLKLDNADSELSDFRVWFDLLSHKLSEPTDTLKTAQSKGKEHRSKAMESEFKRPKNGNKKHSSENNPEISALFLERNFVWNQYNKMESNLTDQLRSTRTKVTHANEMIQTLLTNMEQLQGSNTEKDDTIVTLKTSMAKLEADLLKKNEEISRLSNELELRSRSRSVLVTPVLRRCMAEPRKSFLGSKSSGFDEKVVTKKESYYSEVSEKGRRSSKRKAINRTLTPEATLFSSTFKPPKLKKLSPRGGI